MFLKSYLQPHRVTPGRPLNKARKAVFRDTQQSMQSVFRDTQQSMQSVFRDAQQSIQWRSTRRWPAVHLAVSSCCQPGKLVNQILRNGYSFTFFFLGGNFVALYCPLHDFGAEL